MSLHFKIYNTGQKVKLALLEGCEEYKSFQDLPFSSELRPKVIGLDPTDRDELTKAEILARRQVMSIAHYIETRIHPTYGLATTATQIVLERGDV